MPALLLSTSLPPNGALPKLFPTVSPPSTLSSLPYRSFPTELSSCYFPRFPSVHLVVASVSLLPNGALSPCYFPRFPLSSLPSPSFHTELSPSYFPRLPFRPPSPSLFSGSRAAVTSPWHAVCNCVAATVPKLCRFLQFPDPNKKENMEKKESKDAADIETRRTQKRFPCMSHCPAFGINFTSLIGAHFFRRIPFMEFVPKARCQKLCILVSLPPYAALPQLFPRFPLRPPSQRFRIAPSQQSSPHAISHGFPSVHLLGSFHLAPSPQSSPQAISHGFPPVHPIVASVSLLPNGALLPTGALPQAISHGSPPSTLLPTGALHQLFPTVSLPSTLSSLPYRSFPTQLSPSYFPWFPFRPPCHHSRIAPSHRNSPKAISHGFPPPTLSSLRYRSFPPELSPYFHGFPSVHPFVASVSLPRDKVTKREPKHRRCFWEKTFYAQTNSPA